MRMMFGLVALLVTIGVVVMIMSKSLDSAKQDLTIKKQTEQVFEPGTAEGRRRARESIELTPNPASGRFEGLKVVKVSPGGTMATWYPGLQAGDVIVGVGELQFAGTVDAEDATERVLAAKLASAPLSVVRAGAPIEIKAR